MFVSYVVILYININSFIYNVCVTMLNVNVNKQTYSRKKKEKDC